MSHRIAALIVGLALMGAPAVATDALFNPVFQDHAVLQRDRPIPVWGEAAPGAVIEVTLAGETAKARADAAGHWSATLPALAAGGPFALSAGADAGQSQTVGDVLVGDVYLCSGQSNMVLAVKDTIDSGAEIDISPNDSIRLMTVANVTSPTPLAKLPSPVVWQAAGPASVPGFSGACYYFGRALEKSLHVPLGLIQSAWNGANITTFMSEAALRKAGGEAERLDILALYARDPAAAMRRWGEFLERWWRQHLGTPWSDPAGSANWPVAPEGFGYWSEWPVAEVAHFSGQMWMRTSVTLDAAEAAQEAVLSLGKINSEDQTWVDGRFIAGTAAFAAPRNYALPAGSLHAGSNDIVLNVSCGWRSCGMFGPAEARKLTFKDGTVVPLSGAWRYMTTPAGVGTSPALPWGATAGATVAYNAMIAPLAAYGLRGVVWYQGESNTGQPEQYRTLLAGMMADWRALFGSPLPFLVVQLPDYGVPPIAPEESSWAGLREAQRAVVAKDGNAALAVTIDIGDRFGLHPGDKQEVGRRLALAARRLIYGDRTAPTGPVPVAATRGKGVIAVRFADFDARLVAYNADEPIGFELCAGKSCRFAGAHIQGDTVKLRIPPRFQPTLVRYCWADGPVCTLYDAARLPAVPFELPITAPHAAKPAVKRHR